MAFWSLRNTCRSQLVGESGLLGRTGRPPREQVRSYRCTAALLMRRLRRHVALALDLLLILILILSALSNHAGRNSILRRRANRHGCRFSRTGPGMALCGGPPNQCRITGMPSLGEGPSGGAQTFWLLLGRLPKVTRCKSGTLSSRYRSNGYVRKTNFAGFKSHKGRRSGRHRPRLKTIPLITDLSPSLLQRTGQLLRIRISTARQLTTANTRTRAVNNRQAQLTVAILRRPGDTLKRFKSVSSDQQCIVEAQWGVHGLFLKMPISMSNAVGWAYRSAGYLC